MIAPLGKHTTWLTPLTAKCSVHPAHATMEFLEARPESLSDVTLVVPIAVAFAVLVVAAALLQPKRPRAVVSKLFVYPIKCVVAGGAALHTPGVT